MAPASSNPLQGPELQFMTALWNVWQALSGQGEQALRTRHGLGLRAFITLSHIQAAPTYPAALAQALGLPRYEISRVLGELETRGAVIRTSRPGESGRVVVTVTPQGGALWRSALDTLGMATAPALDALGPDREHLTSLLTRVAQAAQGDSR
ncbi:MarR family winged helix-turn-helix transcriptional regulator [uncultured Deinococcus sp.]|uniref:MarR family winged helix-turn-helix transcriptional regulator n=1 Tax=uncultured Deinococcus sp. TaxID=158789 RepID=UPI0037491E09